MKNPILAALAAGLFLPAFPVLAQQTPAASETEIVLDIVVRDKKNSPVDGLGASDFEVLDEGAKQTLKQVRQIAGSEMIVNGERKPLSEDQQARLVTLVFRPVDQFQQQNARKAALRFINDPNNQNVWYSVFGVSQQLCLLQSFTQDKKALEAAIQLGTGGQYQKFLTESARVKSLLREKLSTATTLTQELRLARVALEMAAFDQSMSPEEDSRLTIFSLQSLAKGLGKAPGRKAVVYLSWGMWVPPNLDIPYREIPRIANRNNVSIYAVDLQGVNAGSAGGGRAMLSSAIASSVEATTTDAATTRDDIRGAERGEQSARSNVQVQMQNLADDTGGELYAGSNDLGDKMLRINAHLQNYYELVYDPAIAEFDGKPRKTSVKVLSKEARGARVFDRAGYSALPASLQALGVLPYELPLMKAMTATPMPRDVNFRSSALRIEQGVDGVKGSMLVEVPLNALEFKAEQDPKTKKKLLHGRLTMLTVIKNSQGDIVSKLPPRDMDFNIPEDRAIMTQAGNFIGKDSFQLSPGRYTIETAVTDRTNDKIGVKKASFVVEPRKPGVAMSSMTLVKSYEQNAKGLDENEPFQFQGGRISPALNNTVYKVKGAVLGIFFIVYPDPAISAKPELTVEYIRDGQVLASSPVPLSPPDATGKIPHVLSSDPNAMPEGTYEIRAVLKQGGTTTEDRAFVTVASAPQGGN